jgi:hypothetical protein
MDVEGTTDEIERQEVFEAPDIRPLSATWVIGEMAISPTIHRLQPNLHTTSSAFENSKGQQRAYQSWKREYEYYKHGTNKLCIETVRPLRWVAT